MIKIVIAILASAIPLAPIVFYYFYRRWDNRGRAAQRLLLGFKGFNVLVGLMALAIAIVWFASPSSASASWWQSPARLRTWFRPIRCIR